MAARPPVDRAAAVRAALRRVVAHRGFHGASMQAVAREAGVAVGTAYVHYGSKDDLVIAAYLEAKAELGAAAVDGLADDTPPRTRFDQIWRNVHAHLRADPERARFLVQVDASPYGAVGHERATEAGDDPLLREAARPDLSALLAPLPPRVLYDLGFGPAIRLVAGGDDLPADRIDVLVEACWRAVTAPGTGTRR